MKLRWRFVLAALLTLHLALPVQAAESASKIGLVLVDWGDYPFSNGETLEDRDVLFGRTENVVNSDFSQNFDSITPGTTIYLPVDLYTAAESFDGEEMQVNSLFQTAPDTALENYEVSTKVDYGRLTLDTVEFTRATDSSTGETGLYLAIRTKDNYSLYTQEVGLDITITAKNGACLWTGNSYVANGSVVLGLDFTTQYGTTYAGDSTIVESDHPVVDFDEFDLEMITLNFEGGVSFEVNAQDQSPLFLRYNTDPIASVTAANPGATLGFLTFEGPRKTFRNAGTLTLPVPDNVGANPHLYTLSRIGQLTEVDATFDASSRTFSLSTKSLDSYIFSGKALAASAASTVGTTATASA